VSNNLEGIDFSLGLSLSHLGPLGRYCSRHPVVASFQPGAEHGAASSSPGFQAQASPLALLRPQILKLQQFASSSLLRFFLFAFCSLNFCDMGTKMMGVLHSYSYLYIFSLLGLLIWTWFRSWSVLQLMHTIFP